MNMFNCEPNLTDRRERNRAAKIGRLREAAARLFTEDGFEQTTIRRIAEEADIGLGTVYTLVRDKHDLLDLISKDDLARVEAEVFATLPARAGVVAQVRHVFDGIYAHHARNPRLAAVIVKELSFSADRQKDERSMRFLQFMARLGEVIAAAQTRGEVPPDVDPQAAAMNVFGLHFYYLVFWLGGALDPRSRDQLFEGGVRQILRPQPRPHGGTHAQDRTRRRRHRRTR